MTIRAYAGRVAAALLTTAAVAGCLAAFVGPAAAMTFQPVVVDGREGYLATGQITLDTPSQFTGLAAGPGTLVILNSPGGNVGAAVELGSLFRSRGVTAMVAGVTQDGVRTAGSCYSACVYALVGASHRVVPRRSQVGIHRMAPAFAEGDTLSGAEERAQHRAAASVLMGYTARMGVDPSMIVSAERTPSTGIHVLTPRELARWGVANER